MPLPCSAASLIGERLGAVAQLGERVVRNDEVRGSIPLGSTKSNTSPDQSCRLTSSVARAREKRQPLAEKCMRVQKQIVPVKTGEKFRNLKP